MAAPKISVLLCTVRPGAAYVNHPEWHVLQKVIDDLEEQSFKDFDLVVVDGLHGGRDWKRPYANFPITHIPPTASFWTAHRKVAICRYRNTGIAHCRGELIVNLDDCCELPPHYLESFWEVWRGFGFCLAALWPDSGDSRPTGDVRAEPQPRHPSDPRRGVEPRPNPPVFGFGSYPREVAERLNGYNEWFDGSQALEDFDWSTRLVQAGVKMHLRAIRGFRIHAQSPHDPRVIDPDAPLVKCCNPAWWQARVLRSTAAANALWPDAVCEGLVGPCFLLAPDGTCRHHSGGGVKCGYLEKGFVRERHELAWEGVQAARKGFKLEELR